LTEIKKAKMVIDGDVRIAGIFIADNGVQKIKTRYQNGDEEDIRKLMVKVFIGNTER
jgi:hypothetical protein